MRQQQDGNAIRTLREANGFSKASLSKAIDALSGDFSATPKTISRWEKGEKVQGPAEAWGAFKALREKGKLARGDLDAVGMALGQIEKALEAVESSHEEASKALQSKTSPNGSSALPDGLDCTDSTLREHWQLLNNDLHARLRESRQSKAQAGEIERLRQENESGQLRTRLLRELKLAGKVQEFADCLGLPRPVTEVSRPGFHFLRVDTGALEDGFLQGLRLLPDPGPFMAFDDVAGLAQLLEFELRDALATSERRRKNAQEV